MPRRRLYTDFMRLKRLHRRLLAFVAVIGILFAQAVLARYVCPGQNEAAAMAAMMAAGAPCDGMDSAAPVLCHQHCADAAQSFDVAKLPSPSLPAVVQVITLPLLPDGPTGGAIAAAIEPHPPPSASLYLLTARLRI